jgi:tRNA threonylcarbamoyl adenosine modification protein YeaZ
MKILAIEFSSEQRSAALFDNATGRMLGCAAEAGGRQMKALTMLSQILKESGCAREDIDCIAVGLGPGSYTGIRAAISLAQGWALARGTRLLGISSVEVLAHVAQMQGLHGSVHLVINAQRNEYYAAEYEISANVVRELNALKLVSAAHVQELAGRGAILAGPEAQSIPGGKVLVPNAGTLAQLAAKRPDYRPGELLEPIYLREIAFVKAPLPRAIPE